jgi:hypothetical protein
LLSVLHLIFLSFLLFSCMSFSFPFSLSSCIFWSSPSLLLRFCWASQHHGWVAPSLPVIVTETQYVMFLTLISTARSWWSQ